MPHGLLLCDDLLFATRITGTATSLGLRVDEVGTTDALAEAVAGHPPSLLLIDLAVSGLDWDRLAELLSNEGRPRVVAFGSHVDTVGLQRARDAGCDDVLPRSRFTVELPTILREHLGNA